MIDRVVIIKRIFGHVVHKIGYESAPGHIKMPDISRYPEWPIACVDLA